MDGADLDPCAYGYLDGDDVPMGEEVAEGEDHSLGDESVDEVEYFHYLNPPAYGYPDDGEERPPFVLVEPDVYFADRNNATTAYCDMRDLGGTFKVTFCTAHPPLVSYLCVHATAFDHTEFAAEPEIIATETNGSLLLLRLVIGKPCTLTLPFKQQFFLYDASIPSLVHLPQPDYLHEFNDSTVAIVRKCMKGGSQGTSNDHHHSGGFIGSPHGSSHEDHDCSNCDYVLAAQSCGFGRAESTAVVMYHSDTKAWSKVPVVNSYPSRRAYKSSKTLTIGGSKGTVAWVDLWKNILLCDVLDKRPTLYTLELPPSGTPINNDPRTFRDIAVLGGKIKYVERNRCHVEPSLLQNSSSTLYNWKVTLWSINTGSSSPEDWHMDYLLNSTEIPQLWLTKLQADEGTTQRTLLSLKVGLPNLSLQDDDTVYFLAKVEYLDTNHIGWVFALDMRNKFIQKVAEFSSKRTIGLEKGYIASRISKYLKRDSGAKQNMKRPGMPFFISSSKKHLGNSTVINFGGA